MDNNKRVLIAVVLCLGILLGWQHFFPNYSMIQQAPPAQNQAQQPAAPAPAPTPAKTDMPLASAEPLAGRPITVTTPLYKAVINSSGAVLEHFSLIGYKESIAAASPNMDLVSPEAKAKAPLGLILDGKATWREASWATDAKDTTLAPGQTASLVFTGTLGDLTLTRTLTFNASTYLIDDAVALTAKNPAVARLAFTLAAGSMTGGEANYNPTIAISLENNKLNDIGDPTSKLKEGKTIASNCKWVAVTSNYFISALLPRTDAVFKLQYVDGATRMAAERESITLPAGQPVQLTMDYYLGPKTLQAISTAPNDLKKSLDYGWFHIVAEALLWLLHFLYGYVGNYGVAIIILTMFIKAIFWPLSQKSYRSMEKMRKLQPMMAAIREKYPNDRNKMNEELMQLYKTYKVNPAGGCLPVVVQIPVFFGLYQALLNSIELRHAPFITHVPFTDIIWLADLSAKDPFYITPLIMGATMFIQQRMTPAPGDPTQAKVMMFMPVIFTFMFLNFPSGLVVYWLVNNVLSIAQQWMLMRESRGSSPQKA